VVGDVAFWGRWGAQMCERFWWADCFEDVGIDVILILKIS
jgi:hypothetical protein